MTDADRYGKRAEGEVSDAAILEARAQLLAQPLPEPAATDESVEMLVFSRAGEMYAVEAESAVEIVPLNDPTRVPLVPAAVLGVVNHRGRIIPVVDLARLLPAGGDTGEGGLAVVVAAGEACFALRADAAAGLTDVEASEMRSRGELADENGDSVVRGLTQAMVAILDVEALARDRRVRVDDEVE